MTVEVVEVIEPADPEVIEVIEAVGPQGEAGTVFTHVGDWSNDWVYTANDVVTNQGGSYVALIDHVSGSNQDQPGVGALWEETWGLLAAPGADGEDGEDGTDGTDGLSIRWLSTWQTSMDYYVNDAIEHNGTSFICTVDHISDAETEPGVGASWTNVWWYLAVKGAAGDPGDPGVPGDPGAPGDDGAPGADGTSFAWEGPWATATAYQENDTVSHGGSSYIATSDHTSGGTTEPGVGVSWATVWDVMAEKGDDGDAGDTWVPDPTAEDDGKTLVTLDGELVYADPSGGPAVIADDDAPAETDVVWYDTDDDEPGSDDIMLVIAHGSDPDVARPSEALAVYWIGSVEPNNAADNDLWSDEV